MVETGPANNTAQDQGQIQAEPADPAAGAAAPAPVDSSALPPAQAVGEMNRLNQQHALEQIRNTLFAIDEVTYLWSISDDQLTWSENLHRVVPNIIPGRSETGRAFASLLDHDNEENRYDTVVGSSDVDQGQGVPYQLEYKLWPAGVGKGEPVWLEDKGRWYASPEGSAGYAVGAVRVINSRHAHEENLKFLSQFDPLTGMMNRGCIVVALGEAIALAERSGSSCSFLLAAMDNLDVINDAYGFDVADQVIASVSQRLRRHMRNGDSIGRYAGNKFALILNNCNDTSLKVAAERFLQAVRQTVIETDNGPVWTTISMGGVVLPTHARETYEAMVHAEDALSEAKNRPTDCFVTYKPSKRRASMRERNVSCTGEIVAALKQNRFVLAFQPIMHAQTGQPAMYEALLRIAGQDGQVISAGHLLPISEKLGLIRLIDRRVLEMGIAILHQQPTLHLTLNISGVTATDTRWFEMFVDYIASNAQVAERLTVEITETVALSDLEEIIQFIERLQSFGCKVAIDDFGAGYTSFRNLQIMNIDMVKLDGAFCEDLAENPDNQYFVKTLVDMAKRFNVEIVAEWVQREEDAELLRQWGVHYLQGHLFGAATIDPPWGRLEQSFGSDGDGQDPIGKVLHAGKPDLPGLHAMEGAPAPGEKWSAEVHADRRKAENPSPEGEATDSPSPEHMENSADGSLNSTDALAASTPTEAQESVQIENIPETVQPVETPEQPLETDAQTPGSFSTPSFEIPQVQSDTDPAFSPAPAEEPAAPESFAAGPAPGEVEAPPSEAQSPTGTESTPPAAEMPKPVEAPLVQTPEAPAPAVSETAPSPEVQSFEAMLGDAFGAPETVTEPVPPAAPAPPAGLEPTAVPEPTPAPVAEPAPLNEPAFTSLPETPPAQSQVGEHPAAAMEDPFAAIAQPFDEGPGTGAIDEQIAEPVQTPLPEEPAAPAFENVIAAQTQPTSFEDPFSADAASFDTGGAVISPEPQPAPEQDEVPAAPTWPNQPAQNSLQPDIAAAAQTGHDLADLTEMPSHLDTTPATTAPSEDPVAPMVQPNAPAPEFVSPDPLPAVDATPAAPSPAPAAFAWLSSEAASPAPAPTPPEPATHTEPQIPSSAAVNTAAAAPYEAATPPQEAPMPAPPATPVPPTMPQHPPTAAEPVDVSQYNGMQPAPEFEPAQPSSNVLTPAVETPAAIPAEPQAAYAPPPADPFAQYAQPAPPFPAQPEYSADAFPADMPPPMPQSPMPAQIAPSAPAPQDFMANDPMASIRPPAPPSADPDEFARKLQEALGPLSPAQGPTPGS